MDLFRGIRSFSLANGVRGACLPRRGFSVEIHVFIATGSMHERERLGCGTSHFLEHMLFQGCAGFSGRSAAENLEKNGGEINAYTTFERTVVTARVAPDKLLPALRVLSAMVRAPEIPAARFAKEREVILRECDRYADNVSSRLFDAARKLSFPGHPIGAPVIGYPEKVAALTKDDLADYHARRYTPGRCTVVAVGNVDADLFREGVETHFDSWRRSHLAEEVFPAAGSALGRRDSIFFADPQERLLWGMPLPGVPDAEAPVLDLFFGMLGGSESAFLPERLERAERLALRMRSFYYTLGGFGYGGFCGAAESGKLNALRKALEKELKNGASRALTAAALQREKRRRRGDDLASMNDFALLADLIGNSILQCGRADYPDLYRRRIEAVGIDELRSVAAKRIDTELFDRTEQRNRPERRVPRKTYGVRDEMRATAFSRVSTVLVDRGETPTASARLVLPGGAVFEKDSERGASLLWSQLFLCGGNGIGETEFLSALDDLGASVSVDAGANTLAIDVNAPRRTIEKALALTGRVLADPGFTMEQFEREKTRLAESLLSQTSSPLGAACDRGYKLLFGDHPLAGVPPEAAVKSLTEEGVRKFWKSLFCRRQCVAGFSGENFPAEKGAELFFGGAPWHDRKRIPAPEAVFPRRELFERIELPREQVAVAHLLPGIRIADDRPRGAFSLLLQNENGLFSRLFRNVREKDALVYSTGMRASSGVDRGAFVFYGLTRPDRAEELSALLRDEIRRLATGGITSAEFRSARERLIFENGVSFEQPETELSRATLDLFYGLPPQSFEAEKSRLSTISCTDFKRSVRAVFDGAFQTVVFAGASPK